MSKRLATMRSVFGKEIELTGSVWFNKILKDHIEFEENEGKKKGFVITTFFISKHHKLLRRGIIWQKQK